MAKDMMQARANLGVRFLRLFPSSRDIGREDMTEEQRKRMISGHDEGNVLSFSEFLIGLEEHTKMKEAHKEYSVVEAVIKAAIEGKLVLRNNMRTESRTTFREDVNVWDILRDFIKRYWGKRVQ